MGTTVGSDVEAGFAKLQGEDFEYYMQTYSIMLGRNSKKSTVDVDLASLGGGMNISRHHARIFYDFTRRRFALEVLGKNGCLVEGTAAATAGGMQHHGYHGGTETGRSVGSVGVKKGRGREYYEDYGEEEDVGSGRKKVRREAWYGGVEAVSGGKTGLAGAFVPADKKGEGRSRVDRESDNQQLMQLEEKDVVSSVATVLSDLCGPGEWMAMEKLHAELVEQFSSIWHHSRVRRYLKSEDWPGPESKGKPWVMVILSYMTGLGVKSMKLHGAENDGNVHFS
ncbi:FHA domain-containing protein FHA2 [Hibiscus syriacus]|uniref:FHA domain-containing protein FHA2 n=1 Tax=Hibiscus syriacus TaxID=106335 RepID=A0A6A2XCT4_HIBSY|nr:FHA domain-containing protein FHA2 [Hibiscus syriacus]